MALCALLLSGCTSPESPRELVERSLQAMAVPREAGPHEGLVMGARGVLDQGAENQGRRPGSTDPSDFRETLAVNGASARIAYEYRHERYDDSLEWIRDLYANDERTIVVRDHGFALRLQSNDFVAERQSVCRRFPHLLLREALAADSRLRALPSNETEHRVAFDLASGETLELVLDRESNLLSRVEYVTDLQSFGDTDVTWSFDDYRPVEGFGLVPRSYGVTVGGRAFTEMEVDRVSAEPDDWTELLSLPEDMEEPELRRLPEGGDASSRAEVETVAPGIHRVKNLRLGFHPMFIELADSLVALDAPAGYRLLNLLPAGDVAPGPSSAWLSERYLELIEAAVPDKPVRYVVLTHFHNDHAGGLRAFVGRGATVVGPASIQEAVEHLVAASHTVAPDALSTSPQELHFERVEGLRKLGPIELIDVGTNPHTDAMLVVHLPKERILFASDLIEPWDLEAAEPRPIDRFTLDSLQELGLNPERIFTMHSSEPVTSEHLRRVHGASK